MYPIELAEQLKPYTGRILQDLTGSRRPLDLAPCTGRLLTGVRYLRGSDRVALLLEASCLPDEPAALTIPAGPVERVVIRQPRYREPIRVELHGGDGAALSLWLAREPGRAEDRAPAPLTPAQAAVLLEAAAAAGRECPMRLLRERLGYYRNLAGDTLQEWQRAGWLTAPATSRSSRRVTEAGERAAREVVGG
jgi:hypothetical protein